jgi:hypothetical protein
LDHQDAVY